MITHNVNGDKHNYYFTCKFFHEDWLKCMCVRLTKTCSYCFNVCPLAPILTIYEDYFIMLFTYYALSYLFSDSAGLELAQGMI